MVLSNIMVLTRSPTSAVSPPEEKILISQFLYVFIKLLVELIMELYGVLENSSRFQMMNL